MKTVQLFAPKIGPVTVTYAPMLRSYVSPFIVMSDRVRLPGRMRAQVILSAASRDSAPVACAFFSLS